LATGMGHNDEGSEKGRVGSKKLLKNDRYECDKGEERNPMEFFTTTELYSDMKNIAVMKFPNA
jgi:hypothetical protein